MSNATGVKPRPAFGAITAFALAASLGVGGVARAQATPAPYAEAPLEQYRMAVADEIALARTAAPASVSDDAEILVLGAHNFETAVKGKNGFVCLVQRAWSSGFGDPEFWNPKERAPICLNPASVRSVLPTYLKRTEWVLSGATKEEVVTRTAAAMAAHEIPTPEIGAMTYMMSKRGYLNDQDGHWHPHIMFFLPRTATTEWTANRPDNPVTGAEGSALPYTVYFVLTPVWSDGSPAPPM